LSEAGGAHLLRRPAWVTQARVLAKLEHSR
jgi:hypothetical protein